MSKTQQFPLPVAGIDSLSVETALLKNSVREATNVDIARSGRYKRRQGYTPVIAGDGYHSLYQAVQRGITLVAQNDLLLTLDVKTMVTTPFVPLNSPDPLSYVEYNGNVYWTNKRSIGYLPSDSRQTREMGMSAPTVTPDLSVTDGGLLPGKYGVTMTIVDERGEESGTCAVQVIDLPNGGGIRLSNMPVFTGWRSAWRSFIYITSADGEQLRLAASPPCVFPVYVVSSEATGGECDTHGLIPMPPGDFIRWHAGRLYTAGNGALRFSEAMRPHLHNPAHGVIPFSGNISFIESVTDGMYVGDSRGVWFLSGLDPTKFELTLVSTCRAVVRSSLMVPPEHFPPKIVTSSNPVALWLSTSGYVVGMENGVTVELQPDRVKVPAGLVGRTMYLFRDGMKQVVTPVNSTSTAVIGTAVDSVIS